MSGRNIANKKDEMGYFPTKVAFSFPMKKKLIEGLESKLKKKIGLNSDN